MAQYAPQQLYNTSASTLPLKSVSCGVASVSAPGANPSPRGQVSAAAGLPRCLCHLLRARSDARRRQSMACGWQVGEWPFAVETCQRAASARLAIPQRSAESGSVLKGPYVAVRGTQHGATIRLGTAPAALLQPSPTALPTYGATSPPDLGADLAFGCRGSAERMSCPGIPSSDIPARSGSPHATVSSGGRPGAPSTAGKTDAHPRSQPKPNRRQATSGMNAEGTLRATGRALQQQQELQQQLHSQRRSGKGPSVRTGTSGPRATTDTVGGCTSGSSVRHQHAAPAVLPPPITSSRIVGSEDALSRSRRHSSSRGRSHVSGSSSHDSCESGCGSNGYSRTGQSMPGGHGQQATPPIPAMPPAAAAAAAAAATASAGPTAAPARLETRGGGQQQQQQEGLLAFRPGAAALGPRPGTTPADSTSPMCTSPHQEVCTSPSRFTAAAAVGLATAATATAASGIGAGAGGSARLHALRRSQQGSVQGTNGDGGTDSSGGVVGSGAGGVNRSGECGAGGRDGGSNHQSHQHHQHHHHLPSSRSGGSASSSSGMRTADSSPQHQQKHHHRAEPHPQPIPPPIPQPNPQLRAPHIPQRLQPPSPPQQNPHPPLHHPAAQPYHPRQQPSLSSPGLSSPGPISRAPATGWQPQPSHRRQLPFPPLSQPPPMPRLQLAAPQEGDGGGKNDADDAVWVDEVAAASGRFGGGGSASASYDRRPSFLSPPPPPRSRQRQQQREFQRADAWRLRNRMVCLFPVPRLPRRIRMGIARAAAKAAAAAGATSAATAASSLVDDPTPLSSGGNSPADVAWGGGVHDRYSQPLSDTPTSPMGSSAVRPLPLPHTVLGASAAGAGAGSIGGDGGGGGGDSQEAFSLPYTVSRTSETPFHLPLQPPPLAALSRMQAAAAALSCTGYADADSIAPNGQRAVNGSEPEPTGARSGAGSAGKGTGVAGSGTGAGVEAWRHVPSERATAAQDGSQVPLTAGPHTAATTAAAGAAGKEGAGIVEPRGVLWADAKPSPPQPAAAAAVAPPAAAVAAAAAGVAPPPLASPYDAVQHPAQPYSLLAMPYFVLYAEEAREHRYVVYRFGPTGHWQSRPMVRVTNSGSPPLVAVAIPAVPPACAPATAVDAGVHLPPSSSAPTAPQSQPHANRHSGAHAPQPQRQSQPQQRAKPQKGSKPQKQSQPQQRTKPQKGPAKAAAAAAAGPAKAAAAAAAGPAVTLQFHLSAWPLSQQPPSSATEAECPATSASSKLRGSAATPKAAAAATAAAAGAVAAAAAAPPEGQQQKGFRPPPPPPPAAPLELHRPGHYLVSFRPPGKRRSDGGSDVDGMGGYGEVDMYDSGSDDDDDVDVDVGTGSGDFDVGGGRGCSSDSDGGLHGSRKGPGGGGRGDSSLPYSEATEALMAPPTSPPPLPAPPWSPSARAILRQELTLVVNGNSFLGPGKGDGAAPAPVCMELRALWESTQRVRPGLLVLATSRTQAAFKRAWLDQEALLPQPDVLILGMGTYIAFRKPGSCSGGGGMNGGASCDISGGKTVHDSSSGGPRRDALLDWQQDMGWDRMLRRSYDVAAVRRAVNDVVQRYGSIPIGKGHPTRASKTRSPPPSSSSSFSMQRKGGAVAAAVAGSTSAAARAAAAAATSASSCTRADVSTNRRQLGSRPAVAYSRWHQQCSLKVCIDVHRSLKDDVMRDLRESLLTGAAVSANFRGGGGQVSSRPVAISPTANGHHQRLPFVPAGAATAAANAAVASNGGDDICPQLRPPGSPDCTASAATEAAAVGGFRFVVTNLGDWCTVGIIPAAASKAAALRYVRQRLRCTAAASVVVAVGDSDRDAEVMAEATAAIVTVPRPQPALQELLQRRRQPPLLDAAAAATDSLSQSGVGDGGGGVVHCGASNNKVAALLEGLKLLNLL